MIKKILQKFEDNKIELLTLFCLLAIAGVAHGYNMFHYPYYENDEGTYMSQAWSLIHLGKLAPYTYWYDHAPMGWIAIALWTILTGGFFTFGISVNSGRVFMLVIHLIASVLLFYISKRLTKGSFAGIIAVLIFSLTPLGIYYQRRVLLDNIMIVWVLGALFVLLKEKIKLTDIIASGVFFGISILTKENAVFFAPAFIYVIFTRMHKDARIFAIVKWLFVTGFIVAFYFLYAFLKGELFPTGFLNDTKEHVSLLATLQAQLNRGSGLPFWNPQSDFYLTMIEWIARDPVTIFGGAIITIINLILCIKVKSLRIPTLFALFFWFFLMRGKLVINFYIIPLISLLALNIGIFADVLVRKISAFNQKGYQALIVGLVALFVITFLVQDMSPYTKDETSQQLNALQWVFDNVPPTDVIAIDDFAEVDYRQKGYTNAFWFWKVSLDSEIQNKFGNDWRNINYIYLSHEMLKQMSSNAREHQLLLTAYQHSDQQVFYAPSKETFLDLKKYQTTNGDWAAIYKVQSSEQIAFDNVWQFYKNNFIHSYGQVIDPSNGNTTSEGQSYGMLRAVWVDDKETFDGVWGWTKDHLQFRADDRLLSWLWKDEKIEDTGSATDGDIDTALALVLAGRRWRDEKYLDDAYQLVDDIWEKEVVEVKGHYYLTAGSGAERPNGYLINPSYFSPHAYRLFAEIDRSHPWNTLADDTYYALDQLSDKQTGLPPNWMLLTKEGSVISAREYITDPEIDSYGFDAFRTFFRVALDKSWFDTQESSLYLRKVLPFFANELVSTRQISSIYSTNGVSKAGFESLSTSVGALSVLEMEDPNTADTFFQTKIQNQFNEDGYWGDKNNYYNQNWAWFGYALHEGILKKF
jgi:endo-1,4-beta-D-glucanase Y